MKVRPAVGLWTLTVLLLASACSLLGDRRSEVESLERQILSMPGVAETELHYQWSIGSKGHFVLDVRLEPDVTDTQAADVGKTFAKEMIRVRFEDDEKVRLHLRLPGVQTNANLPDYSQAEFWFDPDNDKLWPGPDQITDSVAMWLRAARSSGITRVDLTQPWGDSKLTRHIAFVLKTEATDAQITALENNVSGRADVTWQYSLVADATHSSHDYITTPAPPTKSGKELFIRINGMIDVADELQVYTHQSDKPQFSDTGVTIKIADGPDAKNRTRRTAESVAELLPGFGSKTRLTISGGGGSAGIVIGGCKLREGGQRSELELYLSNRFEKC